MALSIGAEGTRKSPENGWLSSRIKKIALATANEPKASTTSWLEAAEEIDAARASRASLRRRRRRATGRNRPRQAGPGPRVRRVEAAPAASERTGPVDSLQASPKARSGSQARQAERYPFALAAVTAQPI
jgi:hypothetical protein